MFVPAPRSLEYVSDCMPNENHVHGLVTVVEGMHQNIIGILHFGGFVVKMFGFCWS